MEKLKFEFIVKSGEDPKTNVVCVCAIMDMENNYFQIPEMFQPVKLHDAVTKTQTYQKVKATLLKRHEKRQVWFSITPELRENYMDEVGNMQFKGYLLEEITSKTQQEVVTNETSTKEPKLSNVKKLSEMFVLEKFTRTTSSVTQWMVIFEAECTRLGLNEDSDKIQVFRLFLEDSCHDWYSSMLIKYTINSQWYMWKRNFTETFASKGWSPIRYAILFKYKQGSLLEYALKKEKLLLEINRLIDKPTLIDLIVIGLPKFIGDKIDRISLKETEDLFNNIRGLEHFISTNTKIVGKRAVDFDNKTKKNICKGTTM